MTAKENLLRVIRHDHPNWVPNGMESVVSIMAPVVERPAQAGRDAFGVSWALEQGAQGGTYPLHNGHPITDLSLWREQLTIPDVSRLDWAAVKAAAGRIDRSVSLVSGFVEMGLFERAYLLLGMEEALMAFLTAPAEMEQLVAALADYKIALISRFHEAAHLDLVWYGDDWGTQSSLFLPPETWRQIIKPHTQRIYTCMRERNIIINQHSCGKIDAVMADIVAMGANVWNPCQPCNNLAALKQRFGGQITFCGGIDSQFILDKPGVTTGDVRAEVRKRIDELAGGGGYIAAPSHGVPYDQALIDAMNDEILTYGKRVYAQHLARSS